MSGNARIEKTVFVAYRRTNVPWALAIFQSLSAHGYDVFFDYSGLQASDFEPVVLENIKARAHFLLLLTPSALERIDTPGDWLRREIETALEARRNIVPLILEGFDFSSPVIAQRLTGKLAALKTYKALPIVADYFEEAMQRLRATSLSTPLEAVLHPMPAAPDVTRESHDKAANQPLRPDQLVAERWSGAPDRLNEGKMILVGRGAVGKTSLVKRLLDQEFDAEEAKTQGIEISEWSFRHDRQSIRVNIWDFGGQEIMHATHQFFLTERSLYLLVLSGREGHEDLDAEYWLKQIETFGGRSHVIVVQNKVVDHPFELDYRGLRERHPQILEFVKVDCKQPLRITALRDLLERSIAAMPEVQAPFPPSWREVKKQLETVATDYVSQETFTRICDKAGVTDDDDRDTLSYVLHCLGIALSYRDDHRLRETTVLRPQWLTHGIYRLLNAQSVIDRKGELYLSDLPRLLPQQQYPAEKHGFLLDLMRKFSLCLPLVNSNDGYLLPELLGKEEPPEAAVFTSAECLNFEYRYAVLPEGLLPRFIVRSHTLSRSDQRWRFGVLLAHEGCSAMVKADAVGRRVLLCVRGADPVARRALLAIIRYDLERIHTEYKGRLDAQPKVPLAGHPSVSIDYEKLVEFERQGIREFPELVGKQVVVLNVNELLNGVAFAREREQATSRWQPKPVFFSYSRKDEPLRDELETHLKLMQRQRIIAMWHDRIIPSGADWDREIDRRIEEAAIILLLVSADFIASDYCWDFEVSRALARHDSGEVVVIPVLLRPCDWTRAPFARLNGLPTGMKPVTSWADRDAAWTDVARGVRETAEAQLDQS